VDADTNWGAYTDTATRAWIGTDEEDAQRSLMRFTLYGAPAGALVVGCTLTVQADIVQAPSPGHVWRVTQPGWTETSATWNTYDGTVPWTTPGGDVDAASGIAFAPPSGPGAFAFPDLTPLCQDAIAARGGHLDLLIRQDTETPGTPHQWSFVMTDDGPSPEPRPSLVVSFNGSAGCGTSTTTIPTTSPTTTTTTPTTTFPACGTAARFESITCRLIALGTQVEQDVAASAFRTNLLALLQGRVLKNVQQADQFASPLDRHRARAHLGHAARGLTNFVRRLNSPRGRKGMSQPSGQAMGDEARALRKAITALAASL
jgi:hypothetical protein